MHKIVDGIDRLSIFLGRVSAVVLVLMTLLILVEIALWSLFQQTTMVSDEYSSYAMATIVFFGAGFCLKDKGHIRITLLLNFLPATLAKGLIFFSTLLSTAFMGYLWWYLYKMCLAAWKYNSMSGTLTRTPLWIPMLLMLVGAVGFFLQLLAELAKAYRDINDPHAVIEGRSEA